MVTKFLQRFFLAAHTRLLSFIAPKGYSQGFVYSVDDLDERVRSEFNHLNIRRAVRALRLNGIIEDPDGYYHFTLSAPNFELLLKDYYVVNYSEYMAVETKKAYLAGESIILYGAIVKPYVKA